MEENKYALTVEGLENLEREYIDLLHVQRYQNIEDLKAARAQGDLSENADYDAARDQQGKIEAKIKQYDYMLSNLELIDVKETKSKAKLAEELEKLSKQRVENADEVEKQKQNGLVDNEVKTKGKKTVKLGSTVTIETLDEHEIETYTIVGTVEADPLNGKISNESPLASALMDKKQDDTVTVMVAHPYKVKIKEIN